MALCAISSNAEERQPLFTVGERLVYDVKALNIESLFGVGGGSVVFEIDEGVANGRECYLFRGTAQGGGLGYRLKIEAESYVDRKALTPRLMTDTQSGSEERQKRLVFLDGGIEYQKMKHCRSGDTCLSPEHIVVDAGGRRHCNRCRDREHYVWRIRAIHDNIRPTYDMLSAIYIARKFDLAVGGKPCRMRVVDGRDLWELDIQAVDEDVVAADGGRRYETIRLRLAARPLNGHAGENEFRGLFGLRGDIGIWVEKESNIPVKIRGNYPLLFDVQIELILRECIYE